ncbi:Hypothetical protein IALB_1343 [Ignavibacterium album JCM 16511]|uniref:Uncharacterized protein n=1 Tax=Ignavibacterium album (strain DSM 19864 / JCM 16511 / NBRC 101810 / Mat9-16) TaxID=945713 RepID=I0AJ96_IGNAJ|nr:hypothetical protein [Ignavibacterium album]AFH49053.1 Hypothetical protein IALB_1343 [Ignavibacterium album JCM 16511]
MRTNNKNTDLIIRYFDGELNESEKENLFKDLECDIELRKEFESIKKIYDLKKDVNNVQLDRKYLDSILTEFKAKIEKGSEKKLFNPAFASALAIVFIALTMLIFIPNESKDSINNFSDISDEELIQNLSQDYSGLIQEEKIDSLLNAELKTAPDKISYYVFNGDDITDLYKKNLINPEDENEIYTELIDKKFLLRLK